ncbi:MAG: putative minor capsid protein [Spirochaetales bacterium]
MASPIMRRLLVHAATLERYTGTTGHSVTYGPALTLLFVRFEPVKQNAMSSLGDAKDDLFTLYIDCANTLPLGTVPAVKDRITFGAVTLTVREVRACFADASGPHHYEVKCA